MIFGIIKKMIPEVMKNYFKKKRLLLSKRWMPEYSRCAYSQEGEDLVIARLLETDLDKRAGFYVDIGAHHPKKHSNTQYFYERGWIGLNVDASEEGIRQFKLERENDINILTGVGESDGSMIFYEFNIPALNSFDKELSETRAEASDCKIINKKLVPIRTIKSILEEHLPPDTQIDFMSIDVEGLDLEVIRSNDWGKFRPLLVLVEDGNSQSINEARLGDIAEFMASKGYEFVSKTALTLFFKDKNNRRFLKKFRNYMNCFIQICLAPPILSHV